jgi:hypothetical protein
MFGRIGTDTERSLDMIRTSLAALALATMVGCSASSNLNPFAASKQEQAQMAAYAASAQYPTNTKAEEGRRAAAVIDAKSDSVEVMNFSDEPMRDVNVWVNGSFVHKLDVIPSHGTRTVTAGQFYDASGRTMASLKATPNRVDLQNGDKLWSLMTVNGR